MTRYSYSTVFILFVYGKFKKNENNDEGITLTLYLWLIAALLSNRKWEKTRSVSQRSKSFIVQTRLLINHKDDVLVKPGHRVFTLLYCSTCNNDVRKLTCGWFREQRKHSGSTRLLTGWSVFTKKNTQTRTQIRLYAWLIMSASNKVENKQYPD